MKIPMSRPASDGSVMVQWGEHGTGNGVALAT